MVCVEAPVSGSDAGWLAAADEVAAARAPPGASHRRGRLDLFPPGTLLSWIDASLDRETPFTLHAAAHARTAPGPDSPTASSTCSSRPQLLFDGGR